MGVYAISGASSGIGKEVLNILKERDHQVINIDIQNGDVNANLATTAGRETAIDQLHELAPDGLDGIICNAGVSGACKSLPLIVSLNYFGAVILAKGVYDLLVKKHGSCVVVSSNAISQGTERMDIADLLNNIGDEQRICNIVGNMNGSDTTVANSIYVATKYALARWVRRISASWAANGVRINAVAPGNVLTGSMTSMNINTLAAINALPIPTKYGQEALMEPEEIASAIVFLSSDVARGINGNVIFVDGGTDALLNSEKVY